MNAAIQDVKSIIDFFFNCIYNFLSVWQQKAGVYFYILIAVVFIIPLARKVLSAVKINK